MYHSFLWTACCRGTSWVPLQLRRLIRMFTMERISPDRINWAAVGLACRRSARLERDERFRFRAKTLARVVGQSAWFKRALLFAAKEFPLRAHLVSRNCRVSQCLARAMTREITFFLVCRSRHISTHNFISMSKHDRVRCVKHHSTNL